MWSAYGRKPLTWGSWVLYENDEMVHLFLDSGARGFLKHEQAYEGLPA